jgi:hypothetical protein
MNLELESYAGELRELRKLKDGTSLNEGFHCSCGFPDTMGVMHRTQAPCEWLYEPTHWDDKK